MITGATAPLGAAIAESLLAERDVSLVLAVGHEAEPAWTTGSRIERARTMADPRVTYRTADLTHPREVHDLIHRAARELEIDTVIHTAQHRDPRDGGRRVHAQNVESVRALVLACNAHSTIRRFVYRSFAEVYAQQHATTSLIDEDAPLEFDPAMPQWLRDRVEADLTVCAHHDGSLQITVLRCAELLAPGTGSQLWDYLSSRVCFRPAGFDPIINVLSLEDAAVAFVATARSTATGVFNIAGLDTLPLSRAIAESNRADIPVPGMMMAPLYKLRRAVAGFEFRYDLNVRRFHFGGVLEDSRARRELGYASSTHVRWPCPWWHVLFARLAEAR
jgi:UDP-glucose 4-epimerase